MAAFPPTWSSLRSVGNLYPLKISYLSLAAIPFVAQLTDLTEPLFGSGTFRAAAVLTATYFGNVLLAIANLLYDVRCPPIIRRFASRNDLYRDMLEIAWKQKVAYPADDWHGDLDHAEEAYTVQSVKHPKSRGACAVTFALAAALLLGVAVDRSVLVANHLAEAG